MNLKFFAVLSSIFWIGACSGSRPTPVYLTRDTEPVPLMQPAAFLDGPSFLTVHHMTTHYQGKDQEADGVLERTPDRLRVVVTGPVGRLFTLTWTRQNDMIFEKGLIPALEVNPAYLLMDITLIYGDVNTLKAHFTPPWRLTQEGRCRMLYHDNQPVVQIRYSADTPKDSDISFENRAHGYAYELTRSS